MNELFTLADALEETYLDFWEEAGNCETPTEAKAALDELSGRFVRRGEALGFSSKIKKMEKAGDIVCLTMNEKAPGRPITLSGHLDTVHPVGSFGPVPCRREDGKLFGPGVMDCKGGPVAALYAMDLLNRLGYRARPVRLILQTDEECNSALSGQETVKAILDFAAGSEAFLNLEPFNGNSAVLWRKGIVRYRFEITGIGFHSSRCFEGASAILEAAHKITELEKMKDENGLTCNVGRIMGGTADNSVPENCWFVADIRFADEQQFAQAAEECRRVAETAFVKGTTCRLTRLTPRPCMVRCARNEELLEKLNRAFRAEGLPELTARGSLGGSDAAYATEAGLPCVDSIGVSGGWIHSPREYAHLASLKECALRLAAGIRNFDIE